MKTRAFEVYTKRGNLKSYLRRAFLEQTELTHLDMFYKSATLKDGSEWQLEADEETIAAILHASSSIRCILSCQEDWQGNKIAVVRLYTHKD